MSTQVTDQINISDWGFPQLAWVTNYMNLQKREFASGIPFLEQQAAGSLIYVIIIFWNVYAPISI